MWCYKRIIVFIFLTLIIDCSANISSLSNSRSVLDLSGEWKFALDPDKKGKIEKWHNRVLNDSILLPGTLAENKKGTLNDKHENPNRLSCEYVYEGWAWYQKQINIPTEWNDKHISLNLERSKLTNVWVDEKSIGNQDSLGCPQIYNLGNDIPSGTHNLTVLVDNKTRPGINGGHQITNETQTNWNGILGEIYLQATDKIWIENALVYPDVNSQKIRVKIFLGKKNMEAISGRFVLSAESINLEKKHNIPEVDFVFTNIKKGQTLTFEYDMGKDVILWDEFHPALYKLKILLTAKSDNNTYIDCHEVTFGMRKFDRDGTQFAVNNKKTFLRGKNDALVFPLLGHPPMDKDRWTKVFKIAKQYGINHYRFHSCCPPEAAFTAADELGIYLQPELYNFGWDHNNPDVIEYNLREGIHILKTYGNHPSFVMFTIGNELKGGSEKRAKLVSKFRNFDNTRLYAQASNYDIIEPRLSEGDDYWTTARTKPGSSGAVRGSFAHGNLPIGHIQILPPSTEYDYSDAIKNVPVPVIGHEIGQFQVYPNFKEIDKYRGVQKSWNLEIFQKRLKEKDMSEQSEAFFRASGALSVICYKEDIETALRSKGFAGFQILDLQDFPGQGTALVGILDSFMDSKGLITPLKWRQFCSETVPLLRFPKYTWTIDEVFTAKFEIAHYGPSDIIEAQPFWTLTDAYGNVVSCDLLPKSSIQRGTLYKIGKINIALSDCQTSQKYIITIGLKDTNWRNQYPVWVYPSKINTKIPADGKIKICRNWNNDTISLLKQGKTVILAPKLSTLTNSIEGFFASDYWCYPMFKKICQEKGKKVAPGTLGILCDPKHPLFSKFPTEFHSNWQWWHLLMNSRSIILDKTPSNCRPIVQTIDNFERNHKLGLIFECRIDAGKLLICSIDVLSHQKHPESRQMLYSLISYAGSTNFNPSFTFTPEFISSLLK